MLDIERKRLQPTKTATIFQMTLSTMLTLHSTPMLIHPQVPLLLTTLRTITKTQLTNVPRALPYCQCLSIYLRAKYASGATHGLLEKENALHLSRIMPQTLIMQQKMLQTTMKKPTAILIHGTTSTSPPYSKKKEESDIFIPL